MGAYAHLVRKRPYLCMHTRADSATRSVRVGMSLLFTGHGDEVRLALLRSCWY